MVEVGVLRVEGWCWSWARVSCGTRVIGGARMRCTADVEGVRGVALGLCQRLASGECSALLELTGDVGGTAWVGCGEAGWTCWGGLCKSWSGDEERG